MILSFYTKKVKTTKRLPFLRLFDRIANIVFWVNRITSFVHSEKVVSSSVSTKWSQQALRFFPTRHLKYQTLQTKLHKPRQKEPTVCLLSNSSSASHLTRQILQKHNLQGARTYEKSTLVLLRSSSTHHLRRSQILQSGPVFLRSALSLCNLPDFWQANSKLLSNPQTRYAEGCNSSFAPDLVTFSQREKKMATPTPTLTFHPFPTLPKELQLQIWVSQNRSFSGLLAKNLNPPIFVLCPDYCWLSIRKWPQYLHHEISPLP